MRMTKAEKVDRDLKEARSLADQARFPEARRIYERIIEALKPSKRTTRKPSNPPKIPE